ncbi:MAG: endolytic transglycosylase MltG [Bdellovibrionales bacterium]
MNLKKVFLIFAVGFGGMGFLLGIYLFFLPMSLQGDPVFIDIPPGKTFDQVALELEEKSLIRRALYFKILVRLWGSPVLKVGEYQVSSSQSLWSQFQKIRKGKVHTVLVTFAEGLNHYEMAEILKNANWDQAPQFLKLVWDKKWIRKILKKDRPSLEGYLFPDTYDISKYMTAETFIKRMVDHFTKSYQDLIKIPTSFSRHQIVTFASLIEKETGVPQERPMIASVFYNRLKKHMRLQTDPTILYSLYLTRGFSIEKNIRRKDILMPSPYNTYVIYGLPKGPIANPGKESLQAVFQPASSPYLYFVSRNDGTHAFSKTYAEHEKKVYEYQIKPFQKKSKN